MAQDNERNFALRENGEETSVYSGRLPRQAALKAARDLEPHSNEEEAEANSQEIRLREKGSRNADGQWRVHVYQAWAWESSAPEDSPDWMPEEITDGNVSKEGVDHVGEI